MAATRTSIHGQWSSRWIFILAATGSAVGLGNIWRFPYETAENGGGAFVLVYLVCIALVGLPVLMAETMIGRRGRQSPINSMKSLAEEEQCSRYWQLVGIFGVAAGFLILTFYSVVAGWTLSYVFRALSGVFSHSSVAQIQNMFAALTSDPLRLLAWHTIFMAMTIIVIARGVKGGLEQAVRFLMPVLFALVLVLVCYSLTMPGLSQAIAYLFKPDFSQINPGTILSGLGHAFFTLSLGMGAIMAYGAYLPEHISIPRASLTIAALDTCVALLAGIAIFPIMFSYGLQPHEAGAGLIFKVLPIAFGKMPMGNIVGLLFFVLLMFAAWTSAISLLEPATAWLVERKGLTRVRAAAYTGGLAWVLGIGSLLSLNLWSEVKLFGMTFFGLMEYLSINIMLPLGGLLIAVFAGWFMSRVSTSEELNLTGYGYKAWKLGVRFIAPLGVLLIMLHTLFGIF